ncbi:hypothetical protein M3B11_03125 [Brevibacterium sp. p3-SID960]|uniref:hypothetical protein n=1 Tax=Brevibacterium sp. p3-SID960 TaxID=2916063 RepID=UPI0021A900D1|nr:hypothetical protein [Brevibacterium sp. p3-SID960]MCT1689958.1 hypothetical protein [Brevibacterium sp. p3-SID960]
MPPARPVSRASIHLAPLSLDEAVAVLEGATTGTPCIFIVPDGEFDACQAVISRARAASLHNVVLLARTGLSPLGRAVLTDMARSLASRLAAGQLLAVIAELELSIRCLAVARSVTRLRQPTPSLWQHIVSWLPSSRFLIQLDAGVERLRPGQLRDSGVLRMPSEAVVIARGRGVGAEADGAVAELADRLGQPPIVSLDVGPGDWWGKKEIVDLCIAPADLTPYLQRVTELAVECRWCQVPCTPGGCQMCQPRTRSGADV